MKLNNKGYLIIEIVLASMIAFGVAYFLFDLTINIKNRNDDLQAKTIVMTDSAIVENYIVRTLKTKNNASCDSNNKITYSYIDENDNYLTNSMYIDTTESSFIDSSDNGNIVYKKMFSKYITLDNLICNNSGTSLEITIPITMNYNKEDLTINLEYVY